MFGTNATKKNEDASASMSVNVFMFLLRMKSGVGALWSTKNLSKVSNRKSSRPTAYRCTSNVFTIGYGKAKDPQWDGEQITETEAEIMLENYLIRFQRGAEDVLGETSHVLNDIRCEPMIEMALRRGRVIWLNLKIW